MFSYSVGEFLTDFVSWLYGRSLSEFVNVSKNFLRFLAHFFSIKLLLRTLFSPWHRLSETYPKGLDLEGFFSSLIVNILMRLVGFVSRSVIIIFGILVWIFAFALAVLGLVLWILSPFIILAILASGIILISSVSI